MAMNTWLQMVTASEIDALKKNPPSITKLDKKDASYSTYYPCSINYFLMGAAYPDRAEHPLGSMLFGSESVDCSTLETGNFGLVSPRDVNTIATNLAKVDLVKLAKAVDDVDTGVLSDEEVDDFEILAEAGEGASKALVAEIERLAKFYRRAADTKVGVVMYTS